MSNTNLLLLGKFKELLSQINIDVIPVTDNTKEVAQAILIEIASCGEELLVDFKNIFGINSEGYDFDELGGVLESFLLSIGDRFLLLKEMIRSDKIQQQNILGDLTAQALIPRIQEIITSTSSELFQSKDFLDKLAILTSQSPTQ